MKHYIQSLQLAAVLAFAQSAMAQTDPCAILNSGSKFAIINNTDPICTDVSPMYEKELSIRLSAQLLVELRSLTAEIRGLRTEMQSYAAGLKQARNEFNTATTTVATNQENWRKEALAKTLEDIANVPVRLGADPGLRNALLATLKEELPKDEAFLQALLLAKNK